MCNALQRTSNLWRPVGPRFLVVKRSVNWLPSSVSSLVILMGAAFSRRFRKSTLLASLGCAWRCMNTHPGGQVDGHEPAAPVALIGQIRQGIGGVPDPRSGSRRGAGLGVDWAHVQRSALKGPNTPRIISLAW